MRTLFAQLHDKLQNALNSVPLVREVAFGVLSPEERFFCLSGRKEFGKWGENLAVRFLRQQGLEILGQNLRCGSSELDILCRHGSEWAFVEVRCRRSNSLQSAEDTLGPRKMSLLIRGASWYVEQQGWDGDWRIDLIAIDLKGDRWSLRWLRGVELEGGMDHGF